MAKKKTYEYPMDLVEAQRALAKVRAERSAYLAGLPLWNGDVEAMMRGVPEEQLAESRRLEEAERDAVLVVVAHPYWETLAAEDRVDARMQLKNIDDQPAAEQAA